MFGHDETIAEWVARQAHKSAYVPPFTAIGVIDEAGTLTGGFVFTTYTGEAVELSLAGGGCFSRGVWRGVLDYVFNQLKCDRLSIHTRQDNKFVKKRAPRAGFFFEGVARRMYGRHDGLTFSLTRDDLPAFRKRWAL